MKTALLLCLCLLLCSPAVGQLAIAAPVVANGLGQPIAGAKVAVCVNNPGANPIPPCQEAGNSLISTFTTLSNSVACSLNPVTLGPLSGAGCTNPGLTDGFGNMVFYSNAVGTIAWYEVYGSNITTYVAPLTFPYPAALNGVINALSFAGTGNGDIGDKINQAYASCAASGCQQIIVPSSTSCYSFSTPIVFGTSNKPALLTGGPGGATCLTFTGTSGSALTLNWGTSHLAAAGVRDLTLNGPGLGVGTENGIQLGGANGVDQAVISGVKVNGFGGACIYNNGSVGSFNTTIEKSVIIQCTVGVGFNGPAELVRIAESNLAQSTTAIAGWNGTVVSDVGVSTDVWLAGDSFDDDNLHIRNGVGTFHIDGGHFENVGRTTHPPYITNNGGNIFISKASMLQDDPANTAYPAFIQNNGGTLTCDSLAVFSQTLGTVTQAVQNSTLSATAANSNCRIANSSAATVPADVNSAYTAGQLFTWPMNHTYSTVFWYNYPLNVGPGNFSISAAGATPLILNCTSGTTCGDTIQKSGTQKWARIDDASDNLIFQNASSANELTLSQTGNLGVPGQVTASIATGTAPLVVNSTTPVGNLTAVPAMYNAAGTQATNAHIVEDKVTLNGASPAVATLSLSGSAVFTSNATFQCTATNQTTAANSVKLNYSSGSAIVVTGPNAATDVVGLICAGN